MRIEGNHWRSVWLEKEGYSVGIIDQSKLPHFFLIKYLNTYQDVIQSIGEMEVRGAPLIGVVAAYGLMLAMNEDPSDRHLKKAFKALKVVRPTAINLSWALKRMYEKLLPIETSKRFTRAIIEAEAIANEDIYNNERIGINGLQLIQNLIKNKSFIKGSETLNILTHCNAGWMATVDWGTALSPIYKAHNQGINIHVWVNETRPRNQGANITAFELAGEGIPHTLIVDSAAGYLMQSGKVDLVIVGADRVTASGDVCNKIGTYLKAIAAYENKIPFYVALPVSTFDCSLIDGLAEIPIEIRSDKEIKQIQGIDRSKIGRHKLVSIDTCSIETNAFNPAFDITPYKFISKFITEKGVINCGNNQSFKLIID